MDFIDHFLERLIDGKLEYLESLNVGEMVFSEPDLRKRAEELVAATADTNLQTRRHSNLDDLMEIARRLCKSVLDDDDDIPTEVTGE